MVIANELNKRMSHKFHFLDELILTLFFDDKIKLLLHVPYNDFISDQLFLQVKIEQLVTAMGGALHSKTSLDINFVIVKNVLAAKYKVCLNS